MKTYQGVGLLLAGRCFCTARFPVAQAISVSDPAYPPPGYPEGPLLARMFVPAVSNGIGVVLLHGSSLNRLVAIPWCDTLAAYGYVAMSIEYPDFAPYPREARTAKVAVEFLRRNASRFDITTGKIAGFGMSQGAYTWGETIIWDNDDVYFQTDSTIDDHLDAAVLLYGGYD